MHERAVGLQKRHQSAFLRVPRSIMCEGPIAELCRVTDVIDRLVPIQNVPTIMKTVAKRANLNGF
jgi:hypothetical protein